jgi:lysophospholipase L1-like esterase
VLDNSETIDAYLEPLLNDSVSGTHVEVINAAITSTWTHHHLIYLNQRILSYDPDMVLFLDGFNDFCRVEPNHVQFASYSYGQPAQVIMGEPTIRSLIYQNGWWLFRKSAAAHVASRGVQTIYRSIRRPSDRSPVDVGLLMGRLTKAFPETALKMHQRSGLILRAEGVRPVFMLQPLLILERDRRGMPGIERELFEFNVSSYRPNWEAFMHRAVPFVREREQAMADSIGGTFVDLSQPFDGVEAQVYTDYAHLTPLGNRLLAERIASEVLGMIRDDLEALAGDPD